MEELQPPTRVPRTVLALAVTTAILSASTAILGVLVLQARQVVPPSPSMLPVHISGLVDRSNITGTFWFQFDIARFANINQPGSGATMLRIVYANVTNGSSPWSFVAATELEAGKAYNFVVFIATNEPWGPLGVFPTSFFDLNSPVSFSFKVWLAGSQWEIATATSPST